MELAQLLPTTIHRAGRSFEQGELAFLALTSKVERPFLDRLSYQLYKSLDQSTYTVAREFPVLRGVRADIAVLKGSLLLTVIEAKAMCTADCTREEGLRREYPDLLRADLQRYAACGIDGLQVFSLLLGTHLLVPPAKHLTSVVKYRRLLTHAFHTHLTAEAIRQAADDNLERFLRPETRLTSGLITGGSAFGVPVELLWWLYGPFPCSGELAILRPALPNPQMQPTNAVRPELL
ncbi:MAG TPA: hypothetical protein VGR09_08015 [Gemmatimonadales bacterium]|nr:hypothetical protein [Gemmatimonadales bacterium]